MPLRAATGAALMIVALGVAYVGGFPHLVFWGVASAGVAWEWQRLLGGERLWPRVGVAWLALLVASPFALHARVTPAALALFAGAVAAGLVAEPARRVWSGAGVIYAGGLLAAIESLRASPAYGLAAEIWLFAVVWGADIGAYFGGRLIGGPKLWPRVSPGKTWSGAIVGALCAAILGAIVAASAAPSGARLGPLLALGFAVAVGSQIGDLFESAMKRRAGVKDSSRLIPGHGGLMDRLDGFIVASVVAAAVAAARSSGTWIAQGLFQW